MSKNSQTKFLAELFKKDDNFPNDDPHMNIDNAVLLHHYESLTHHHPDIILVVSSEGKIIAKNLNKINHLLGNHQSDEFQYFDFLPPATYEKLKKRFKSALAGRSKKETIQIKNRQKQTLHLQITFIPIPNAWNNLPGVYVVIHDTTAFRKSLDDLKIKEKHLNHAQQISQIGSWEYEVESDTLIWSPNFYDIFGIDHTEEISLKRTFDLTHPDDVAYRSNILTNAFRKRKGFHAEYRIFHGKTNEIRYLVSIGEYISDNKNRRKFVGVTKDVTEQRRLEKELITNNKSYENIFNHLDAGIWFQDYESTTPNFLSKGMTTLYDTSLDKLYKSSSFREEAIHPEDLAKVQKQLKKLTTGKKIQHQYRIITKDGKLKWIADQTIPSLDEQRNIKHLFGMQVDISPEMKLQQQFHYNAKHDQLTGLPNQQSLHEKLNNLCNQSDVQKFALLYIDLDHFNRINHALGYEIGNIVIQKMAERIVGILPENSYLSRVINNDLFAAIIQSYDKKETVIKIAKTLIKEIRASLEVSEYELYITASIGVSFYPENGKNKNSILEMANTALQRAKNKGKNNYQLSPYTNEISFYKKFLLETDLREAIKNNDFEIYYQPIINTHNQAINSAEAKIRWYHEVWGFISVKDFIPIAEEHHLIHKIDDWKIKHVCSQIRVWIDKGYTIYPISINISPNRLLKNGLFEVILENLNRYQIPPEYLIIEITKSKHVINELSIPSIFKKIRGLGVRIAYDNFGIGFTSFDDLHDFKPDMIKIDQLFIKEIDKQNNQDLAIITAILQLAKQLGMKAVADGVDTYEQYQVLKQNDCDYIQGHLFSKPVPLETFEKIISIGYLMPKKQKQSEKPKVERRKYFRFIFPSPVIAQMKIIEVNKTSVDLAAAPILIENISLGGIKIMTMLRLPVNANIKMKFIFTLMNITFEVEGAFRWIEEKSENIFIYGVQLNIQEANKNKLAHIINRMSVLNKQNQNIPNTKFIKRGENAISYLMKHY